MKFLNVFIPGNDAFSHSENILQHVHRSHCFPFLLSEQGFFQNCKQSEAERAMEEQEAEGDPNSHRCTCGERHRHHGYGCYVKLQWGKKRRQFRLTRKKEEKMNCFACAGCSGNHGVSSFVKRKRRDSGEQRSDGTHGHLLLSSLSFVHNRANI